MDEWINSWTISFSFFTVHKATASCFCRKTCHLLNSEMNPLSISSENNFGHPISLSENLQHKNMENWLRFQRITLCFCIYIYVCIQLVFDKMSTEERKEFHFYKRKQRSSISISFRSSSYHTHSIIKCIHENKLKIQSRQKVEFILQ